MRNINNNECIIWGTPATVSSAGGPVYHVDSKRAGGTYTIDVFTAMRVPADKQSRTRITSWLVSRRRAGELVPHLDQDVIATALDRAPIALSERVELFFLYLSSRSHRPGRVINMTPQVSEVSDLPAIAAWTDSEDYADANALINLLVSSDLVMMYGQHLAHLTAAGFQRLEQAERSLPATNQAFVAMWFGAAMNAAYERGIEPAILETGHKPLRIDRKEHANKIDDEIVMEIRRSKFVIADFTCPLILAPTGEESPSARGGVYYEAGFAQGLGLPVIWSVRQDLIEAVHFDTRQFAHITWESPDDLRVKLRNRIGAVIASH